MPTILLGLTGQEDSEVGTLTESALENDRAAMHFYEPPADSKAEARAGASPTLLARLPIFFENRGLIGGSDAWPRVFHGHGCGIGCYTVNLNVHAALVRKLHRVADDIAQYLAQSPLVGPGRRVLALEP